MHDTLITCMWGRCICMICIHVHCSRMRKFKCRLSLVSPDHQIFLSFPNLCIVIVIRACTSIISPPPASKIEPRYLNCHTLSTARSPHFTFDSLFCLAFRFCVTESVSAVWVTFSFLQSKCPVLVRCAFISWARLYRDQKRKDHLEKRVLLNYWWMINN